MRNIAVFLARHLVVQLLATGFRMLLQIILPAGCDTEELGFTKWVFEHNVSASTRIMREPITFMHLVPHELFLAPHRLQEAPHLIQPLLLDRKVVRLRVYEVLDFQLLELTRSEQKLPWCNLIAEGLAHLGDTKGDLLPSGSFHILEVDENALSSLRSQVAYRRRIRIGAHIGGKHQVESPGHGERSRLPCGRRWNVSKLLLGSLHHVLHVEWFELAFDTLFLLQLLRGLRQRCQGISILHSRNTSHEISVHCLHLRPHQLVRSESPLALLAVTHGIAEGIHVARSFVHSRVGND
mmetsp:Transcript_18939/g.44067  ORF Transcript_18939/g.44067 Transcript_18939/m.44067 type:complete len:295 (-) Transcript_18939:643-1527(-)